MERIYNEVQISYEDEPAHSQEPTRGDNKLNTSLDDLLSPQLRLLIQRQMAAKKEADRLAKAAEYTQVFNNGEDELVTLLEKTGTAIVAIKKRKCSLQYLQQTIAAPHNVYLQVKGLNEQAAGRKCQ